jgi:ribulose bisphosphate carboxylase small subunit
MGKMRMDKTTTALAERSALLSLLAAGMVSAALAADLRELEDEYIDEAHDELRDAGYRVISEHGSDRDGVRYYWDGAECLSVEIEDDRVDDIDEEYDSVCEQLADSGRDTEVRYVESAVAADVKKQEGRDRKDAFRDLQAMGYESKDNYDQDRHRYDVFWNDRRDSCIRVKSHNGKVQEVEALAGQHCGG